MVLHDEINFDTVHVYTNKASFWWFLKLEDNGHLQVIGNINQKKAYALVGFEKNTLQRDSMGKEPLIAFNHEWFMRSATRCQIMINKLIRFVLVRKILTARSINI